MERSSLVRSNPLATRRNQARSSSVNSVCREMITLFTVHGSLMYVDPDGRSLGYDDVFTRIDRYREHFEAVGLGALGGLDAGYLSAGQTKRLSLARLLVSHRDIWLLDEPLASLDAAGDRLVVDLLAAHLARGGAAIAATHDDIAGATQTLVLERP